MAREWHGAHVSYIRPESKGGSECARDQGERTCGDEGTRTPNPCLAKAVLCQLSYAPVGVVSDPV
jgi:hypothetical protein